MSEETQPRRPWFEEPKPVVVHSGNGFDTEARIVTPDDGPQSVADDWPPRVLGPPSTQLALPPSPMR